MDQVCKCQTVTDLITKSTSLSCFSCGIANSGNQTVSFPSNSCNCVNAFDASTNKTYLSCVCKNVPQCQDPSSIVPTIPKQVPAPCTTSYPCSCAAIVSASLLINNYYFRILRTYLSHLLALAQILAPLFQHSSLPMPALAPHV